MILKVLEPLSPQQEKQTETQIYLKVCLLFSFCKDVVAAQGLDEVNPPLSAAKGVNRVVTRFAPFFTPQNRGWVYFFEFFKINAGEKRRMSVFLFSSASFLSAAQAKIGLFRFGYIANGLN